MAYSHTLTHKGIKRRDLRMCKKGAESAAVSGSGPSMVGIQQAVDSMAAQG